MRRGLIGLALLSILFFFWGAAATFQLMLTQKELHKAQVCNKVFVLYLKHNQGLNINLDRIYEDGVKWVDDPQYQ